MLGLKWSDIDFTTNNLTVNRTITRAKNPTTGKYEILEQLPKTKNALRTVPIPTNIILRLKDHKLKQNKYRLKVGEAYFNNDYVFANDFGYVLDDKRPGRNLNSILKSLGIEPMKFHALRHTYATRLFEANVPPKTVQVLMGHSDIGVTMNTYTHIGYDDAKEELERMTKVE